MTRSRHAALSPSPPLRRIAFVTCVTALCWCVVLSARAARADQEEVQTFHIAEISKLMVGYNGDATIQAVEIKMTFSGQNLVTGMTIAAYNGSGVLQGTLGTFGASVPSGANGGRILCATTKFQTTFGITPDLVIAPGIPVTSGQVSYETAVCRVNSLAYGAVTTPLTGTTSAPPLPAAGATVLVRTVDDPTSPTCPLSEDSAARFALTSGGAGHPVTFTNNAGVSVNVASTVVGVDGSPPAPSPEVRVSPNPFRESTRIDAPDWGSLTIHDLRGRLVRVLTCEPGGACPDVAGPYRGLWDGTDLRGKAVPSGIYFLRYSGASGFLVKRVVLIR